VRPSSKASHIEDIPRKLGITEPTFYHVISHGNLKNDIFDEPCDYDFFLSLLFNVKIMTNH